MIWKALLRWSRHLIRRRKEFYGYLLMANPLLPMGFFIVELLGLAIVIIVTKGLLLEGGIL